MASKQVRDEVPRSRERGACRCKWDVGKPVELFRKVQPYRLSGRTLAYDVSADGNRFLLVLPEHKSGAQPAVVVLDWFEDLKSRVRAPTR